MKKKQYLALFSTIFAILLILGLFLVFTRPSSTASTRSAVSKTSPTQVAHTQSVLSQFPSLPTQMPTLVPTPTPTLVPTPTSTPTPTLQQGVTSASAQAIPPAAPAGQRTFMFANTMSQTVWVGVSSNKYVPLNGGWALAPGTSMSLNVPNNWGGRIWGRAGCTFNSAGNGSCASADCNGHLQCANADGTLPRSLGEFTLDSYAGLDFYDVSLVDGYNLPMFINTFGGDKPDPISANGCNAVGCIHDVNATCPAILQKLGASGNVVGCQAPCNVLHADQYCCRGAYNPRPMCNPIYWPVNYAKVFKDAEPFAYSYPDDDATSTFSCKPKCNYKVTFGLTG